MRKRMTKKERMRSANHSPSRSCVRAETGLARIPKICIHGFECSHCAFDQWIEEMEREAFCGEDLRVEKNLLAEAA
ncbi:MAG: hypothetical protein PVI20_08830 [Desulfobacteraceae bacterium]